MFSRSQPMSRVVTAALYCVCRTPLLPSETRKRLPQIFFRARPISCTAEVGVRQTRQSRALLTRTARQITDKNNNTAMNRANNRSQELATAAG
ncbi:hypothetical protein BU23DRAFT_157200 [Bimuria novae-zelandiae CBS 107.79]|uniref:Uncharacterized protein n=1 Tax=Bimuria novae-zelandiae CBS 107.79 TaxID=1447943 RepID=A0A6A5V7C6_9PLEO|nr:hypothetical protein BU23DRAFT_157200 [Bimuria novae-zelandiae CBS 107.79]